MAKINKGLGMGLDALLKMNVKDDAEEKIDDDKVIAGFVELPIDKIIPNPDQPRKEFNEEHLNELAASIKNFGLIQPISVVKSGELYEIIAGERRYRASKLIGLDKVPVIIKDISQKEKFEMSLVENIQRENLNPVEEALAYSSIIETYSVTQDELASSLGKSRTAIANSIRLLNLDVQIRKWLMEGKLTAGHARAVLSISNSKEHVNFASHIIDKALSVREAEVLAKKWPLNNKDAAKSNKASKKSLELKNAESKLQERFQTKVTILGNTKKGKIDIEYFSEEELERIIEILGINL